MRQKRRRKSRNLNRTNNCSFNNSSYKVKHLNLNKTNNNAQIKHNTNKITRNTYNLIHTIERDCSFLKNEKGLSLVAFNAGSMFEKTVDIFLNVSSHKPDMFFITETWLNPALNINNNIYFEGFNCYRQDRNILYDNFTYKKGGGIAAYINENYIVDIIKEKCITNNVDIELMHISVKAKKLKKYFITIIYRPPSGTSVKNFFKILKEHLNNINHKDNHIFLGDFNIDFTYSDKQGTAANKLKNTMISSGFTQLINSVTRNVGDSSTIIDLIFVNTLNQEQFYIR